MNDQSDNQLLDAYVQRQSEPAFTQLVQRHVDLVYSVALRMVGDAHAARDVSQSVFIALAQNAPKLANRPALEGWLFCTTRNLAAKYVRADARRRVREQESAAMNELLSTEPDANWEQIAGHLDEAIGELEDADRDALLLRYFKNQDLRTVGAAFGVSDDAAQKRVSRALEHLREFFASRGLKVGASGLAAFISAKAVQAAPVGLALEISKDAAVVGVAAAAGKVVVLTTLQKAMLGTTLALAVGAGIYESREAAQARSKFDLLQSQQTKLVGEIDQLHLERDAATEQLAALRRENEKYNPNENELLKLRAEVGRLRGLVENAQPAAQSVTAELRNAMVLPIPSATNPVTGRIVLKRGSVMLLGVNRIPSGRHAQLLVCAKGGEDNAQLSIQATLLALKTEFMQPTGTAGILGSMLPEQADMFVEASEKSGAEAFIARPVTAQIGEQTTIQMDVSEDKPAEALPIAEPTSGPNGYANPSGVAPSYVGAPTTANPLGVFPGPGLPDGSAGPSRDTNALVRIPGLNKLVVKITPTPTSDSESIALAVEAWFAP